jgi:hypothetical protein
MQKANPALGSRVTKLERRKKREIGPSTVKAVARSDARPKHAARVRACTERYTGQLWQANGRYPGMRQLTREQEMRIFAITAATAISVITGPALAAVGLDTYVDKNGFINVQELTCDQLANTYQEDANALANWYSGWYNGLAKKHYYHLSRVPNEEHKLIVYCKAHRDEKIIHALDKLFKEEREKD